MQCRALQCIAVYCSAGHCKALLLVGAILDLCIHMAHVFTWPHDGAHVFAVPLNQGEALIWYNISANIGDVALSNKIDHLQYVL